MTGITGSGGSFTANPTGTDSLTAFDGAFLVEDGPSDGHDSIAAAILSTGAPITDYNGNTFPPNWAGGAPPQPGVDFPGYAAANFGNANYLRMESDPNFSATGQNARYGDFSFTNITSSATALGPIYFGVHARDAAGNTGFLRLEVTAPTVTTQQMPSIAVANFTPISDTAYVTGGIAPYSSTVTFNLYDNPNGNGPALFTDTEPLVNDLLPWTPTWKATATSASYTPTAVGTVYWVATFNGDANNPVEHSGYADEPVTVVAPPTVTTVQSATNVFVGASIADTAYVTGGITPYISGSTVTFNLYNNLSAIGPALFTDTETLAADGTATSGSYTTGVAALTAGTVYWVATFNGDANNPVEHSGYGDEKVTVTALPLRAPAATSIPCAQLGSTLTFGNGSDPVTYIVQSGVTSVTGPTNSVLLGVTDPNPGVTSITTALVSTTSHGTLILNANGTFSYTANVNDPYWTTPGPVSDSFAVQAVDNYGAATPQFVVTIPVNRQPVYVAPAPITVAMNSPPVTGNLLTGDSDLDGDTIGVTSFVVNATSYSPGTTVTSPAGQLTVNADGSFTFLLASNFSGSFSFSFTVGTSDPDCDNSATFTQTIAVTSAARTQGYWKTHEAGGYWTLSNGAQISSLTIGGATYTANEVVAIMNLSTGSGTSANAILILFDQLVAAKLNVANGVIASSADLAAIPNGDAWIKQATGGNQLVITNLKKQTVDYFVSVPSTLGQEMVTDANILDTFNNGL